MGWWITLAVLVGLAILPVGVSAKYNASGVWMAVLAGPIRIKILPAKKKDKKPKKEKPKKDKKPKKSKKGKPQAVKKTAKAKQSSRKAKAETAKVPPDIPLEEKYPDLNKKPGRIPRTPPEPVEEKNQEQGGSWTDFLTLVPIVLDFLNDFRRKLRVDRLDLKLILASGDPCDLAVNYGKVWTAMGAFLPQLERFVKIRKRNIEVECDFLASETKVIARADLTITLGRLLAAAFKFAFRALVEYFKILKKRKGGAAK